jgi:hypothetical protein
LTRLTTTREWGPLWSADGSHVLFMQADGMGRVRLDGSAPIERLHDTLAYPHTVTPDGRAVLFQKPGQATGSDIWIMSLAEDRSARPLLNSPANEAWAELSPDGKWLAYGADWSGRFEVYIQPFPGPRPREQVSFGGGDSPLWSRSGRELFFLTPGDAPGTVRMNAVEVTIGTAFTSGKPRVLFQGRFGRTGGPTAYDVSPDGRRFLTIEYLDPAKQQSHGCVWSSIGPKSFAARKP